MCTFTPNRNLPESESVGCWFSHVSPAQSFCHSPSIIGQLHLRQIPVSTEHLNAVKAVSHTFTHNSDEREVPSHCTQVVLWCLYLSSTIYLLCTQSTQSTVCISYQMQTNRNTIIFLFIQHATGFSALLKFAWSHYTADRK